MAIGGEGNNYNGGSNGGKNSYDTTYFSRLRIKNDNEKLSLSISFRSGLMIFSVDKMVENFKYDNVISIFISPTKARLLFEEIEKFESYLKSGAVVPGKAFGINTGMGEKVSYIGFHSDETNTIYITIGKFDNNGNITESTTMSLNKEYHFSLEWDDIKNMQVNKSYNDMLELQQLKDVCFDFARSMSGATAYSVSDLARYDLGRVLRKMDPIFDKLGIERLGGGNNNGGYQQRSNNFLNNSGSVQSNHTSIDEFFGDDE